MAKSRSIPTALLQDPDYMELASDIQVILLMLVLTADDEGRGQAHSRMLSRHFNKPVEIIEDALATLAELDLVTCYVVGRHCYYQLLCWSEWQTLSKPTSSRFPHPPASFQQEINATGLSRETQETSGQYQPEGEGEGKGNRREQNPETKEKDTDFPPGVTRFPQPPTARADASDSFVVSSIVLASRGSEGAPSPTLTTPSALPTQQVANILHLPVTEPLTSLMTEYATFGSLALLGEADAAYEWIEDRTRNRKNARMTVAFFRRWLKREQERIEQRTIPAPSASVQQLDTLADTRVRATGQRWRGEVYQQQERRLPSLMHLVEEDKQARGGRN